MLNFSVVKPLQQCGFIENYQGFQLIKQRSAMEKGNWTRTTFSNDPGSYRAFYISAGSDGVLHKSECDWNCSLEINNISPKIVYGKIAVCFNDSSKSWIAGKFEAAVCNN